MSNKELQEYFLCGIGTSDGVYQYSVGRYDKDKDSFSFPNGSYSPIELHREPRGSNASCVVSAVSLADIDDAGLLEEAQDD